MKNLTYESLTALLKADPATGKYTPLTFEGGMIPGNAVRFSVYKNIPYQDKTVDLPFEKKHEVEIISRSSRMREMEIQQGKCSMFITSEHIDRIELAMADGLEVTYRLFNISTNKILAEGAIVFAADEVKTE
jgi:hypothetical protein